MQLFTIGVNHTTAPISIRENVAFSDANLRHALGDLTAQNVAEAAILSTCNRTEIYVQSNSPEFIINWLAVARDYDGILIAPYCYTRRMTLDWYNTWDCASACVWNARAIERVDYVGKIEHPREAA